MPHMSDVNTQPDHNRRSADKNWSKPSLSIVIPSYNERDNIEPLYESVAKAMGSTPWEMIVVDDDSPDGTAEVVRQLAQKHPNLHCIHRIGRRGLSSACVEGISASIAPVCAVMDADHQHDEAILPDMFVEAQQGANLVVGSRYVGAGSTGNGLSSFRLWGSQFATWLASVVAGKKTTDPMSGFFMLDRTLFDAVAPKLSSEGFKILLDIIVSAATAKVDVTAKDVPYTFRERLAGESKMSPLVVAQFMGLWFSKLTGGFLPTTFVLFAAVGVSGLAVHLSVLGLTHFQLGFNFNNAQIVATLVAMTWNFFLNNELTYANQKLKGRAMWVGLLSFYAVCSLGAIANVSVANVVYSFRPGAYLAGFAGAIMSSVFNYAVTRMFTWRK